jgi:predicted nucleic acid-binding protein
VSLTALDTGFFVRLLQGDGRAVDRWRALVEGEGEGVVSGLSLVELLRLSLKGGHRAEGRRTPP